MGTSKPVQPLTWHPVSVYFFVIAEAHLRLDPDLRPAATSSKGACITRVFASSSSVSQLALPPQL